MLIKFEDGKLIHKESGPYECTTVSEVKDGNIEVVSSMYGFVSVWYSKDPGILDFTINSITYQYQYFK